MNAGSNSNNSSTFNPTSVTSESSGAAAGGGGGGGIRSGAHPNNNNKRIRGSSSCSALVSASDSLVLENEEILKLFPKCRPRSQNESMNHFYASIKDHHSQQHQPPGPNDTLSKSGNAIKKIINDSTTPVNPPNHPTAAAMSFSRNSSAGGGGGGSTTSNNLDYSLVYSSNKLIDRTATNPFLTHNSSDSQMESEHLTSGGGAYSSSSSSAAPLLVGGRKLTHSQSDCGGGACFGANGGANVPFPTAAATAAGSSSTATELMSKNFQRHMKNPLNNTTTATYQSNPFIGGTAAAHKLDEYEEELNIIVQDQQQRHSPEYYFERRPSAVRPNMNSSNSYKAYGHNSTTTAQQAHSSVNNSHPHHRSTPVGNLLHSPEGKGRGDDGHKGDYGLAYNREHHYLNVGRSPVNSSTGDLNEEPDETVGNAAEKAAISQESVQSHKFKAELPVAEKQFHETVANKPAAAATKKRNKSVAVVSDGEVVIFDDIEESWYNLKVKPESIGEGHVYKENFIADPDPISPERRIDEDDGMEEEEEQQQQQPTDHNSGSAKHMASTAGGRSSSSSGVAGMVIEYSESPRRFGAGRGGGGSNSGGALSSQYSPRPGFPQRIVTPVATAAGGGPHLPTDELTQHSSVAMGSPSAAAAPLTKSSKLHSNASEAASHSLTATMIMEEEDLSEARDVSGGPEDSPYKEYDQRKSPRNRDSAAGHNGGGREDQGEDEEDDGGEISNSAINVRSDIVYKDTGLSVRDSDYSSVPASTFDYLYEFSETRKVLEEFFKCPTFDLEEDEKFADKLSESECDSVDIRYEFRASGGPCESRKSPRATIENLDSGSPTNLKSLNNHNHHHHSHHNRQHNHDDEENYEEDGDEDDVGEEEEEDGDGDDEEEQGRLDNEANEADVEDEATNDEPMVPLNRRRGFDLSISSMGRHSPDMVVMGHSMMVPPMPNGSATATMSTDKNGQPNPYFRYSPETTDYDSNCGDLDSLSGDFNAPLSMLNYQAYMRQCYASMPVLEDGLSSGHASDAENNNTERVRNGLRSHLQQHDAAEGILPPTGLMAASSSSSSPIFDHLATTTASSSAAYHPIISTALTATSSMTAARGSSSNGVAVAGSLSDVGNAAPNHQHFVEQQQNVATDNYYSNASNKQQSLMHTCMGGGGGGSVGDSGCEPGIGKLQTGAAAYEITAGGNNNLVNNTSTAPQQQHCNRYNGDSVGGGGGVVQLNDSLNSVSDIHHLVVDRTFTTGGGGGNNSMLTRDENLNPIDGGGGGMLKRGLNINSKIFKNTDPDLESLYSINKFQSNVPISDVIQMTSPPPPAPAPYRKPAPPLLHNPIPSCDNAVPATMAAQLHSTLGSSPALAIPSLAPTITTSAVAPTTEIQAALKDIRSTIQRTKNLQQDLLNSKIDQNDYHEDTLNLKSSAVWIPSFSQCREDSAESCESDVLHELKNNASEEEEPDTDLETDRLLGHQRSDDTGFYDNDKNWLNTNKRNSLLSKLSPKIPQGALSLNGLAGSGNKPQPLVNNNLIRHGLNAMIPSPVPEHPATPKTQSSNLMDISESISSPEHSDKDNIPSSPQEKGPGLPRSGESPSGASLASNAENEKKKKSKSKEVLIEGVLFRAKYLGSTQLVCEGQPTKSTRMMQAEEAVSRIKAPEGEGQPSTEVDLFISTEKIMVLNTDLKEIMMDHALRTISYIADIGDLVVLMARRRFVPQDVDDAPKPNRTPKMICHVFESEEAQFIAQSIGQAFQVAYMEFLKANGIEDHSFVKEMDYQEVLNSQEIFGDELEIFAKKELQKEVVVPKAKGEILGVVIVESGWGSMLPTVVIANLLSNGAAARCGQLNIGDQIIAINGLSLVGLPLSTCQTYIKNTKNQTVVKFTVVPCAPVVEVKIKRPNTKYQLGFSVQNGVICSLLRGGIAERGGVRVGHRIIEINNQSVVAVPHEKIVNLLATSVGEILMKTMPTSMFRLLTGQENPIYI